MSALAAGLTHSYTTGQGKGRKQRCSGVINFLKYSLSTQLLLPSLGEHQTGEQQWRDLWSHTDMMDFFPFLYLILYSSFHVSILIFPLWETWQGSKRSSKVHSLWLSNALLKARNLSLFFMVSFSWVFSYFVHKLSAWKSYWYLSFLPHWLICAGCKKHVVGIWPSTRGDHRQGKEMSCQVA